ncbi:MAG TPA: twin-arginine translocation signal domain-containing protein [Acidobacteriota bacterium]|jgi:hypothetical protein
MKSISRRDLIKGALAVPAAGLLSSSFAQSGNPAKAGRLADFGWSWEGQGLTGGGLSIFGVGEGVEYWGLRRAFLMWHPSNELAMQKLRSLEEVICEISPSVKPIRCGENCVEMDSLPAYGQRSEDLLKEVETVGRLSLTYPNINGVYLDDSLGRSDRKPNAVTPQLYASIHNTLTKANPKLKLWALVWTRQLYEEDWVGFKPYMDVIKLTMPWTTIEKDIPQLDRHIEKCREVFPTKPIVLGCNLYRFAPLMRPMPMELVKAQWERVLNYVRGGQINGYTILGTFLIDVAQEQARWIRDFIAAN